MIGAASEKILQEMEMLRNELYTLANGKRELLTTREIYEVSKRLDKLIVKHMNIRLKEKSR